MNWIFLLVAGLLEVVWATGLKHTEGFTRFWPSVLTLGAMSASFYLLSAAMRTLPLGTSYGIWSELVLSGQLSQALYCSGNP
jgi:quaternary ammonium compound-resistance protein SugE